MTGPGSVAGLFLSRTKIKFKRLLRRCPRPLRIMSGPFLGGVIGIIGGIPGFIIGFLLGYLLRKLYIQSVQDRRIIGYFENPGMQEFHEGESGIAAWCALGVIIASHNHREISSYGSEKSQPAAQPALLIEKMQRQVITGALLAFRSPAADPYLIEHFVRLAWKSKDSLNPDLLAESLAARRISKGDAGDTGLALCALAENEEALQLAKQIGIILDPSLFQKKDVPSHVKKDPWRILGLRKGAPLNEVKTHYRRLAKQFHPDKLEVLDEKHRETAAQAFIAIKEAYKEIAGE